jgi:hypothetical protein
MKRTKTSTSLSNLKMMTTIVGALIVHRWKTMLDMRDSMDTITEVAIKNINIASQGEEVKKILLTEEEGIMMATEAEGTMRSTEVEGTMMATEVEDTMMATEVEDMRVVTELEEEEDIEKVTMKRMTRA